MAQKKLPPVFVGTLLGAALGAVATLAATTRVVRAFEYGPYDLLSTWFAEPQEAKDSRAKVLLITDEDLEAFRQFGDPTLGFFPPPRGLWGDLIGEIAGRAKLGAVLLDLVMPDPSRIPEDDEALAAALKALPQSVLAISLFEGDGDDPVALPPSATVAVQGDDGSLPRREKALLPAPILLAGAPRLGNAYVAPDEDGVIRRMPVAALHGGAYVPAFPVAACLTLFGADSLALASDGRTLAAFGGHDIPLDGRDRLLLNFRGPKGSFATSNFSEVFAAVSEGKPYPWLDGLKDGDVVILGANVTGNPDVHATPTDESLPGPELLATAIDNLIRGDALRRPPHWLLLLVPVLLGSAVGGLSVAGYRKRIALWFAVPVVLGYVGAAVLSFDRGLVLDVVTPLSGAFLSYLGVAIYLYRTEGKKRREIRSAFSQYMSEEVVADLERHPESVRLGGEKRVMTVLFSDIAGFTGVSERLTPEQLVGFLNEYLTRMTDTILDCKGVIDKYQGDAIMAFWGAPVRREDHARLALEAAARFREDVKQFSDAKQKEGLPRLDTRIGVNTGPMVVGNMGSSKRFDYTVIGDAVNLSARLEGANKFFKTGTLLTQDTLDLAGAGAAVVRPLGRIRVKGRDEPVRVYELLGAAGVGVAETPAWVAPFTEGVTLFERKDFDAAIARFRACDAARPGGDAPALRFIELCNAARNDPKFDGVLTLTEK